MSTYALVGGRVLADGALRDGLAVIVAAGRIAAVVPAADVPAGTARVALEGGTLLPGFIDVQVNGGGGVLFNDAPTVAGIVAIGAAHRAFGTTGFLPTLISDDAATIAASIAAARAAIAAGVPGVLGVHVEGPFLNLDRRGIHQAAHLRPMDEAAIATLTAPGAGRVLVTLAPDRVEDAAIARLAVAGVVIAAGHSDATYARMQTAFAAGVTGITHLFNAMSPLTSRAPGMVGAALAGEAWCGLIVDGRHVDPVTMRIALAARSRLGASGRLLLVTDAMPCVGSDAPTFDLQGKTIAVRDGACYDAEGRLAGSNLDMATALRQAVTMLEIDLPTASAMASANPAAFLGLADEVGRIAPGLRADLVLLDADLRVIETWIGGNAGGSLVRG